MLLRELHERLKPLEVVYASAVEPVMGHPRDRESVSQLRALGCNILKVCSIIEELSNTLSGRRVCLYGPAADGIVEGCSVHAGPEAALQLAAEEGVRLAYVTGDMDAALRLLYNAEAYTHVYVAHLHGDNMHLEPPPHPKTLYSTQILPFTDCVIGPLGYTDGDRAAVLAMALNAEEIALIGYTLQPEAPHKEHSWARLKEVKLAIASQLVVAAARLLGYRAETGDGGGFPLRLVRER